MRIIHRLIALIVRRRGAVLDTEEELAVLVQERERDEQIVAALNATVRSRGIR